MIDLVNVRKRFGAVEAVQGVTLHAAPGEILGLLGPNGAGKTTTIRMVTGYLPPTSGSVTVAGYDSVRDSIQLRKQIGYMPESAALYPEMRVVDQLHFCARIHLMDRRRRKVAISKALDRCWLEDVKSRRVGQLSKGDRQRVSLACALIHDPPALVLAEPTSGLDPSQIVETRKLVRELANERTMILCSHILPEVERTCDRIVLIARGRVRAEGTIAELTTTPTGSPVIVEVSAKSADGKPAGEILKSLPGVGRTEPYADTRSTDYAAFVVHPASASGGFQETLAKHIIGTGLALRELRTERATLESLFIRSLDEPVELESNE